MEDINQQPHPVQTQKEFFEQNAVEVAVPSVVVQQPKPKKKPVRRTGPVRRSSKGGWKVEEDDKLRAAVKKYNAKNWKKIAELVPNRTHIQCLHRWQKVLNPELIKGKWTSDEDENLKAFFKMYGENWPIIAQKIIGRNSKQCRERYYNHLAPSVKKGAWSEEEEKILMTEQARIGNKWAEISKRILGRTQNACKNQYHKIQNRKSKKSNRRRYNKKKKVLPSTATAEVNTPPINQMFYQYQFQPIQFYPGQETPNQVQPQTQPQLPQPQREQPQDPKIKKVTSPHEQIPVVQPITVPVVENEMIRQDMFPQLIPNQNGVNKEDQMENYQKQQEVYRQYQALLSQQQNEREQFISSHVVPGQETTEEVSTEPTEVIPQDVHEVHTVPIVSEGIEQQVIPQQVIPQEVVEPQVVPHELHTSKNENENENKDNMKL